MGVSLAFIPDESPMFPGSYVDIVVNFDCLDGSTDCDAQLGIWAPPVAEFCPGDNNFPFWPTSSWIWGGFHPWQCPIVRTWFCTDVGEYYCKLQTSDGQKVDCAVFATVIERKEPTIQTRVLPSTEVPAGSIVADEVTITGFARVGPIDGSDNRGWASYDIELWSEDEPQFGGTIATGCDGSRGLNRTDTKGGTVPENGEITMWWDLEMPPGKYVFQVYYTGNHFNESKDIGCAEPFIVYPVPDAVPTLTTVPSADSVYVGESFFDAATLAADGHPTGSLTFELHGPSDPDGSKAPVLEATVTVDGVGTYRSPDYTPDLPGTYHWVARFAPTGLGYEAVETDFEEEPVEVLPVLAPTLVTHASPAVQLGDWVYDEATLLGATADAVGTISFDLYAPSDSMCSTPIFHEEVPVHGNGQYVSPAYRTGQFVFETGTYHWKANYSGDAHNAGTANACNEDNESVTVHAATTKAQPTVMTQVPLP
jgi:hypothetical protein